MRPVAQNRERDAKGLPFTSTRTAPSGPIRKSWSGPIESTVITPESPRASPRGAATWARRTGRPPLSRNPGDAPEPEVADDQIAPGVDRQAGRDLERAAGQGLGC